MPDLLPYALTALILLVSTLARATLGFGDALIAMPLLALTVGLRTAAPLVALVATIMAVLILWRHWQAVDLQAIWRVLLASALGIPVGLLLLRQVPEGVLLLGLGVLLLAFALYNLSEARLVLQRDRWGLAYGFGFLAGVLGGAYNTMGPLLVLYGQLRRWPPDRFRATLQGCFLPAYGMIVLGHGVAGFLTPPVLTLFGLTLPVVLLGLFLGGKLHAGLHPERFARLVNLALAAMGLMLCLRSWPV